MSTFGIDLGTTNSVISRLEQGRPQAIAIDGSPIVPSIVLYRDGHVTIGREARNLALLYPECTVSSVKRSMGRTAQIAVAGGTMAPEDVSADILRGLKRGAELATGGSVRDVVITVPAYFDESQRQATLKAADLAGLHVLRLLGEPTAASMVYDQVASADPEPHTVLVYDLGGGTFDVSVLDVMGDVREVKATNGDTHLGGDDFDRLLVGKFRQALQLDHGVDVRGDPVAMARLQRLAEETKIALSSEISVPVHAEFVAEKRGKPVHLDLVVHRTDFDHLVRPHLERTVAMAREAVTAAGLQPVDIARICLVGGSTRIPLVRELLAEAFAAPVHEEIDVDLAVSLGAALQAGLLGGEPVDRILVDVTAHDLGVSVAGEDDGWRRDGDQFAAVIHRNTVLPTRRTREFYTVMADQPRVNVEVYQGNAPTCANNRLVGRFDFPLKPAPEGSPVRVVFEYDLDGLVRVTVAQVDGDVEVKSGKGKAKTVALRIADAAPAAAEAGTDDVDEPALPVTAIVRKAEQLCERLEGPALARLDALLQAYQAARGDARVAAEEALLDFFVELDDEL